MCHISGGVARNPIPVAVAQGGIQPAPPFYPMRAIRRGIKCFQGSVLSNIVEPILWKVAELASGAAVVPQRGGPNHSFTTISLNQLGAI